MPLAALHTVELQLILQHCDATSLLRLARCCRASLVAADAPFAWQFVPLVSVQLWRARLAEAAATTRPSSHLLRHTSIAVEFGRSQPLDVEELAFATSYPQLHSLAAHERALSEVALTELLRRHGCWQELHTLLLHDGSVDALTDQIAPLLAERLPRLRALGFFAETSRLRGLCSTEALSCLQQLTALRLHSPGRKLLEGVGHLPQLRTLQLVDCAYPEWLSAIRAFALRSLQQLDLSGPANYWGLCSLEPKDVDAAFANLRGLERLTLHQFNYARLVLPAITAHCEVLRLLRVEPVELYRGMSEHRKDCCVPDIAQLHAFLHARPQCMVMLRLLSLAGYQSHCRNLSRAQAEWQSVDDEWSTLREYPQVRLEVLGAVGEIPPLA